MQWKIWQKSKSNSSGVNRHRVQKIQYNYVITTIFVSQLYIAVLFSNSATETGVGLDIETILRKNEDNMMSMTPNEIENQIALA